MAPKNLASSFNPVVNGARRVRTQFSISLIEVLVVIALLIIGLWLMMNVFPTGQRALRVLRERNLARTIAERIAHDLANSAKLEGGLLPDNPTLYELPLADLRQLDLPIDKNGDGKPDEPSDGKRAIEDLLELRRRLRMVLGERIEGRTDLTSLTPISSIIAYRYRSYTEASALSEVTPGSNKYFVNYSRTPPEIVVMFSPNEQRWYRISYIASTGGQRFVTDEELNEARSDASGVAVIVPQLLKNAQGQVGLAVLSLKELVPISLPSLSDEQKRSGVISLPAPPFPTHVSYELGSEGTWMSCWGRTESIGSTTGAVFDPIPKPLIEKPLGVSAEAGVAAFISPLQAIPDTEFEITPGSMVFFPNLSADTLLRLSYRSARSPNQLIDNWFFVAFVPPLSFTPSPTIPTIGGGQSVEYWREYFVDPNDRQRIFVAGMWSGLLINIVYVDINGNRYSILRRVEYDPQRTSWKGVIHLPMPCAHVEKVEGASIKVWVSGRFFLGAVGGKRQFSLGSVIVREALIRR
ncbi:MAG: hypothetical protein RMK18_03760 [Armatimonadota bacterium]|nr:hypothetical protein [Armatimonadota bacterium]MCX7778037.1 hypothetical protein [Armatimonadota bacterium]MDW8024965.1 hypothetical protein [Armatimonadota bacterium]